MRYLHLIISVIFMTVIIGCKKDNEAENIANQEKMIIDYLDKLESSPTPPIIPTPYENIYRVIFTEGDKTVRVSPGDSIFFYYTGAVFTSNGLEEINIFDTNIAEVAKKIKIDSTGLVIYEAIAGKNHFITGLEKGLLQMSKDEKSYLIFTSKYGYGKNNMSTIPRNSPIIFEITMEDVKK